MNFIDTALAQRAQLSSDDFLQAMAGIYQEPEVWPLLNQYPQFIRDVIYIIDYDTELQMAGLDGILESCAPEWYDAVRRALRNCGALREAQILQKARQLDPEDGDYDTQISWLQDQTALYRDYESFWHLVRSYIGEHLKALSRK